MATTSPGFLANYSCNSSMISVMTDEIIKFNVSPNPVNDILTINFNQWDTQLLGSDIFIINVLGKVVKVANEKSLQINVEDLQSGMYFIVLNSHFGDKITFIKN